MRLVTVMLVVLISWNWLYGQATCDVVTNGISVNTSTIKVGQTTLATFDVYNDASGDNCFYPVNSILVVLSFPSQGLAYNNLITPTMGAFFTWNYDPMDNVMYGVNHTAMYDGDGETVIVEVLAQSVMTNTYPACRTLEVGILQNPSGPLFPSNSPDNDSGYTTVNITPANQSAVVECLDDAILPTVPFMTTCFPANPVPVITDVPDGITCEIQRTYVYSFENCVGCPLDSFDWAFVYTVLDTTPPVWTTAAGALDTTLSCSDMAGLTAAQLLFPVANDNCDMDVTNIVKTTGSFVAGMTCSQAGTYTNTWTVTDECGNVSATYTQVITIIDTLAPAWTTAAGVLDTTLSCSDMAGITASQLLFPVANDNCDMDVTNIVKTTGSFVAGLTCSQAGTYTNTWTVTDDCGNLSATYTQVITIIDTLAPAWTTAAGVLDTTLSCSDMAGLTAAQLLFPVANDNCDMDVTNIVKTTGSFVAGLTCSQAGTYTNTWTVSDECGNVSATYMQVITIIDTLAPAWTTAAGALDTTLSCSDMAGLTTAQLLFPVANDNCDMDVTNIVKTTGSFVAGLTCSQAGTYTNTWTVTDECGNVSATYTQVITIIDTLAPAWTTAAGVLDTTLSCSDMSGLTASQLLFPVANDNCDMDVTNIVKTTGSFVAGLTCSQAGTYTNTWTVTDDCGNVSATYTQVITIIDTTGPVITITGSSPVELCMNTVYTDAGATATDACDMSILTVGVNNPVDTSVPGTYTVTYSATDECGNMSTAIRTVIVRQSPTGTISGTTTVVQNNFTFSNVIFTGSGGSAPYTFTFRLNGGSVQTIVTAANNNVVILSHPNGTVGVFVYELLSVMDGFGCPGLLAPQPDPEAIITVIQGCDLSPTIPRPISGSFSPGQTKEGFIQYTNLGPGPTSGTLEFRVSTISNFTLSIPITMMTADGFGVINSSAMVTIVPGAFFTTIYYTGTINAGSNIRLGYTLTATALAGSNGNLTVTILNGTGGDGNNLNNRAVRTFVIN